MDSIFLGNTQLLGMFRNSISPLIGSTTTTTSSIGLLSNPSSPPTMSTLSSSLPLSPVSSSSTPPQSLTNSISSHNLLGNDKNNNINYNNFSTSINLNSNSITIEKDEIINNILIYDNFKKDIKMNIIDNNNNNRKTINNDFDFFKNLPNEIILQIFENLEVLPLIRISTSSKQFYSICGDEKLWKELCQSRYGVFKIQNEKIYLSWKDYYKSFKVYQAKWDTVKKGKMILSNHNKTVTHAGDYLGSYQSIRGSEPLTSGVNYFEFFVNTLSPNQTGFHLVIGIVPESFNIYQTYLTSNGFGYLADGRISYNSGNGISYSQGFVQGSRVGVLFDQDQQTISFFLNGKNQGIAFRNISRGVYYPGISLLTGGQSVSFIDNPEFPKLN